MHASSLDRWSHDHSFLGAAHARNERRTWIVIGLTATMMVAEIVGGLVFGSMALLADGFHMATHAGALALTTAAYAYARRHVGDPRYTFGPGKVGDLAAFTSALVLAAVAVLIGWESLARVFAPIAIRFDEAIAVAVIGLVVNLVSAWLLHESGHAEAHHHHHHVHGPVDHARTHRSGHVQEHGHHGPADLHRDHNLRAAYLHVLADAATSILAIIALLTGRFYGLVWMDPLMGVVGALLIARWSWGLMKQSSAVLLDAVPDPDLMEAIRGRLERDGDRVADLHLWRVGPGHYAAVISLVTHHPREPPLYRESLAGLSGLSHITVEVQRCPGGEDGVSAPA